MLSERNETNGAASTSFENVETKLSHNSRKLTATVRNRIKKQLQHCFCLASEAKNTQKLCDASQALRELHQYASNFSDGSKYFLFCVQFLVVRICEKSLEKHYWMNCMKIVVNVSLTLSRKKYTDMLKFLLDFCQEASRLSLVRLRVYACKLVELLFSVSRTVDEINDREVTQGQEPCLSVEQKLTLYSVLVDREFDTSASVRAEALRAIATIQHNSIVRELGISMHQSPQNIVIEHFKDISWECRLAAVESLSLDGEGSTELMVETALTDDNENVRKASFLRLAKEVKVYSLTLEQRMALLKHMFSSRKDSSSSKFLKQILNGWLYSIGEKFPSASAGNRIWNVAAPELMCLLDILNEEEVARNTIILSLACCKENLGMKNVECRYFVKEVLYGGCEWVANSYSYKNMLNKMLSSSRLSNIAFFLRCLVDFCKLRSLTEGDWSECRYKLLPTMVTFCGFVKRLAASSSITEMEEEDKLKRDFALMQLLCVIPAFDEDDLEGRKAWRELLEFILLSYNIRLSYKVVDHVVRMLYQHFWPSIDENEEALSSICDITSSIMHHSYNPYATILGSNETIALNALNTSALPETFTVEETALLRCVMIINSMMKTNRYRKINTLMLGLLENVVEKGLISENSECRILAFEAVGIMALCDRDCAQQKTVLIKDALELVDSLKVTALNILCNFSLVYGFDIVSEWFAGNGDFGDPCNDLLQVFCSKVWDEDAVTSYSACKCLCQLILTENIKKPKKTLCQLLLKSFHPDTENFLVTKSCLDCFLECYSRSKWRNQLNLVSCFKDVFDAISEMPKDCPTSRINKFQLASTLLSATKLSALKGDKEKMESAHTILCEVILEMIVADCDYDSEVLSRCLCELDVETWRDIAFMRQTEGKLEDAISDFEENKKVVRALEIFYNKLEARIKSLDVSKPKKRLRAIRNKELDKDAGVVDIITRTSRLSVRTPLTRSASKRLGCEYATQNSAMKPTDDFDTSSIFVSCSQNVSVRRSRKSLTSAFEVTKKQDIVPLPRMEEKVEEGSDSGKNVITCMSEITRNAFEEVTEKLADMNCGETNSNEASMRLQGYSENDREESVNSSS